MMNPFWLEGVDEPINDIDTVYDIVSHHFAEWKKSA